MGKLINSFFSFHFHPMIYLNNMKCLNPILKNAKIQNFHSILFMIREMSSVLLLNYYMAAPAHSEAGKIFDFNATLPIMAAQFIFLMIFLDKTWFGPVGNILDERDAKIRDKLRQATGTDELDSLMTEADMILECAKIEAQTKILEAKKMANAKADAKVLAEKLKLDAELAHISTDLEIERKTVKRGIDDQVKLLSNY